MVSGVTKVISSRSIERTPRKGRTRRETAPKVSPEMDPETMRLTPINNPGSNPAVDASRLHDHTGKAACRL
jgi:hypothetical protein